MTDDPKPQPEVKPQAEVKLQAEVQPDVRKNPRRIAFILRRTSPHVKTQDDVRVMTYPTALSRFIIALEVAFVLLVWISLIANAPLEGIADPMHTPNPAKAPWYFLGLQELLHYFPPMVAGVLVPGLVVAALIVIPYFNINIEGESLWARDRKRRVMVVGVVLALFCVFLLVFDVIVALVPTLLIGGLMLWSASFSLESPKLFQRWLSSKPLSFWIMTIGGGLITALDFVGLWLMFHTIDALGGFSLTEIGLLYGATGLGIGVADLLIGSVERIGAHVRMGSLDTMMVRPVPLLVQVCADQFQLRRVSRIVQALVVFAWACWFVDWTPARVLVAGEMVVSGSVIFFCLSVAFSCVQFWTSDASEFANAFTYGGNTVTQYPLTVFPRELVKGLTFVLPLAFVNWYPCLYILGRPDPFGLPSWLQLASPVPAVALGLLTALVWRAGVRHYTSTGS